MKLHPCFILPVLACVIPCSVLAQLANPIESYMHKVRIGLVDEFFARFNGAETHPDVPKNGINERKDNLMMLYDLSMFTSKKDSLFLEAGRMMDVAIKENVELSYSDTTWTALAHCKGKLDGKGVSFDIYLTVEHRREDMYKWVISCVEGELFDVSPVNMADLIMLYPDDHETSFMSLQRMSQEQPQNIVRFLRHDFNYDEMSVFAYLIHKGRLTIDYVEKLEFIFTQIPGYMFKVAYFQREANNAGWLISDFRKVNGSEKKVFLQSLRSRCNSSYAHSAVVIADDVALKKTSISSTDSLKSIMQRRTTEKIGQLKDYISLLQSKEKTKGENREVLVTQIVSLFAKGTVVRIVDEKDVTVSIMELISFCNTVKPGKKTCTVKAVAAPLWNDTLYVIDDSIKKISLSASMFNAETNNIDSITSNEEEGRTLPVFRESTVNGTEWVPLLGDMIITFGKE